MIVTNKFVIPFLFFCLFAQSTAFAAEATPSADDLPAVHILPDNPLYFLKTIKEKVQLLITRNTSAQANLLLDLSQKRLAEAQKVAEKGKVHISEKLLDAFGQDIEVAQEKISQAKAAGEQTYTLLVKLRETVGYQKSVIEKLGGQAMQLNSFLVEIDKSLEATESATIENHRPKEAPGLGIGDWLRSLFGKREILKPLAD